ncbi:MAG: hypothetical protein UIB61_05190 [Treponema sp.]|nr:hypothetical protein [Treponema sp.]
MTKDEMKDKISMALKDPVLQQGFEIICKNLAELEKENAELKSKNCWKTCEYAEPKSQWISQHIQDVAQLSKAKELIKKLVHEFYYLCELYNFATDYECLAEADQFIREVRSE